MPNAETLRLIEDWLSLHDIETFEYNAAKDWVTASVSIEQAESLLNTTYSVYRHVHDGTELLRTTEWSLPAHLHSLIDVVQPTNSFFRARAQLRPATLYVRSDPPSHDEFVAEDLEELGTIPIPDIDDFPSQPTTAQACNRLAISSLCLRTLYGTLGYEAQAPERNQLAIVNFLDQVNNRSDIDAYLQRYRKDAAQAGASRAFTTEIVAEGLDDQTWHAEPGIEGALDAQIAIGVGHPTPLIAYNVGGKPPFNPDSFTPYNTNEPYLVWLHHMLAKPTLPPVISISYADDEQTIPASYARRVCNGFAQLAARGVSVLVPSGDEGVGRAGFCTSNANGSEDMRGPSSMFLPNFPASCPYVTAVGATRSFEPEVVAFDARSDFVSGGGFSNYFPRPRYQDTPVEAYIHRLGPDRHAGLWNSRGRAVPDVSASGYHYSFISDGVAHLTDGTSASTPAVAAIVALINDALIADGRPPLGFLNPWIYGGGFGAFMDVVVGNATGCGTDGFPALEGWDAASGFGTPVRDTL